MTVTEEEFAEIINQQQGRLHHLCRVYAERPADEKDLYQEMLIQVWRSMPSFDGNAKLSTWIYRIAVNTAISFVRRKKTRRKYYSDYKNEQKSKGTPYQEPKSREDPQTQKLYQAISQLNVSEKAVITMYLEDFSYKEIAFVTGMTTNYVGVKLNRIKDKLTKIIGD